MTELQKNDKNGSDSPSEANETESLSNESSTRDVSPCFKKNEPLDKADKIRAKPELDERESQQDYEQSRRQEAFLNLWNDISLLPECSERQLLYLKALIQLKQDTGNKLEFPSNAEVKSKMLEDDMRQQFEGLEARLKIEELDSAKHRESLSLILSHLENQGWESMQKELDLLLRRIRPIDIPELFRLVAKSEDAFGTLEGQDVILFLGATGKSTAIHFLPDAKNKETMLFKIHRMTSSSTGSPTSKMMKSSTFTVFDTEGIIGIHPIPVPVEDDSSDVVFLCDSPQLEDTNKPEVEVFNWINLLEAIKGCKSIKLVLVVSYNDPDNPFPDLQYLASLSDRMIKDIDDYREAFYYIFTGFSPEDKKKIYSLLEKIKIKPTIDPTLNDLLQHMLPRTGEDAFILDPHNVEANKNDILYQIASSTDYITNPEEILRLSLSKKTKDAITDQLDFHQRDIISSLKRYEYCLVKKKLDELIQLPELLQQDSINQFYNDCVKYSSNHLKDSYDSAIQALNSCLVEDNSLKLEDIKKYRASIINAETAEDLRKTHLKEAIDVTVYNQNVKSQVDNMISKLAYDVNDIRWKAAFDKIKLLSESFEDVTLGYDQLCCLFKEKLDALIEPCDNLSKPDDFDRIADSLTKICNVQIELEHHELASQIKQIYIGFKQKISSTIENSAKELHKILQSQKQQGDEVKKLQSGEVEDLKKGLTILKLALKARLLHLHIPKAEIQPFYDQVVGEMLNYFERLNAKIRRSRERNEKSFGDLEKLIEEMMLIREIPIIKHQTAEAYYSTLETICGTMNELKKDIHQILTSFLYSKGYVNSKKLKDIFMALEGAKWIEKHRPGFYSDGISNLEEEILETIKLFSLPIREKSLEFEHSDNLEDGNTIISRINQFKPLENIFPSIKIELDDLKLIFDTGLERALVTINGFIKDWKKYRSYKRAEREFYDEWKQPEFQDDEFKKADKEFKEGWELQPNPDYRKMEESLKYLNQCQKLKLLKEADEGMLEKLKKCIKKHGKLVQDNMEKCLKAIKHPNIASQGYVVKSINFLLNDLQKISRLQAHFPQLNEIIDSEQNLGEIWKKELILYSTELADEMHKLNTLEKYHELKARLKIVKEMSQLDLFLGASLFNHICRSFQDIIWVRTTKSLKKITKAIKSHNYASIMDDFNLIESLTEPDSEHQLHEIKIILNQNIKKLVEETRESANAIQQLNDITSEKIQTFVSNLKNIKNAESLKGKYIEDTLDFDDCVNMTKKTISRVLKESSKNTKDRIKNDGFFEVDTNKVTFKYMYNILSSSCDEEALKTIQTKLVKIFKNELESARQKELSDNTNLHLRNFEAGLIHLPEFLRDILSIHIKNNKEDVHRKKIDYEKKVETILVSNDPKTIADFVQELEDQEMHCLSYKVVAKEKIKAIKEDILQVDLQELTSENQRNIFKEINGKLNSLIYMRDFGDTNLFLSADKAIQECNDHLQIKIRDLASHALILLKRILNSNLDDRMCGDFNTCFNSINYFCEDVKAVRISPVQAVDIISQKVIDAGFKMKKEAQSNIPLGKLAQYLIKMYGISDNLYHFKEFIDKEIGDLVIFYRNQADGAKTIAKLGAILNSDSVGKALVANHPCFQGYALALFNSITQKQGIKYVLENLKGDYISKDLLEDLYRRYKKFEEEFRSLVKQYLHPGVQQFDQLISSINSLRHRNHNSNVVLSSNKILELIPKVFALWTLQKSEHYFEAQGLEDQNNYLFQPHAAQVISIFLMLGFGTGQRMQNNLVEIGTGEGKSIVLAVTATLLALSGFDVSCACYSEYLSQRDRQAFEKLFKSLGLEEHVRYGTFNKLCEDIINQDIEIRKVVKDFVLYNEVPNLAKDVVHPRPKILLIDEVDVFFSKDFYGQLYTPSVNIQDQTISDLIKLIWDNKGANLSYERIVKTMQFHLCYQKFENWQPLIEEAVRDLLSGLKSYESHDYIVKDGQIGYKEQDNIVFNVSHGYKTLFAYYLEYTRGNISRESLTANTYIKITCGKFSYAEIPKQFEYIMGVTGTLESLSESQKKVMETYQIRNNSFMPSVFGANRLSFDERDDVKVVKQSDYFKVISEEIQKRIRMGSGERAVLVFFESKQILEEFYRSPHFASFKKTANIITEETSASNKEPLVKRATASGQITLLTKIFGRGTDFVCYDNIVAANGGVHVIQTFLSEEPSEEKQIKGRTARQGAYGSYSKILLDSRSCRTQHDLSNNAFVENLNKFHKDSKVFLGDIRVGRAENIRRYLLNINVETSYISRTLCLMDATGSMSRLLNQAKATVQAMFERSYEILVNHNIPPNSFQLQFAVYRNYSSKESQILEHSFWESSPDNLRKFMEKILPSGGEGNEAIEIGLLHANNENKSHKISQVILIGDAPANRIDEIRHKRENSPWDYTKCGQATNYKKEIEKLKQSKIPVHAFYVDNRAKDNFKEIAAETGGRCQELNIESKHGEEVLTALVTEEILRNVGQINNFDGNALVAAYQKKYGKTYS